MGVTAFYGTGPSFSAFYTSSSSSRQPSVAPEFPFLSHVKPAARNSAIISRSSSSTSIRASPSPSNKTKPPPLPKTDDPFILLGLDPTADAKEIKRAYRKRAMQYHPDVILTPDSSATERDGASRDFARINAAYEMLTGGGRSDGGAAGSAATGGRGGGGSTSSGGYENYQPPHRRQSGYSSSPSGKSINWEDFMPKYDEEDSKYDAGGDSFGSIFSDLMTGAAGFASGVSGKVGGKGIVGDLIDFLERNVDGFESGYDDDKALSRLLLFGEFDEVASEMDETDLLVTSLETKLNAVENELLQAKAELNVATKFSEKLDIEERIAELKARNDVVKGYLKKGKKRLIRLRERYKELMVKGRGGRGYGGSASSSGFSSSSSSSRSGPAQPPPSTAQATSNPTSAPESSNTKSWRNEGFTGSYGRTSSGGRRGNRRSQGQASSDDRSTGANRSPTNSPNQPHQQGTDENASGTSTSSSNDARTTTIGGSDKFTPQFEPWVPPHRRTQSTTERDVQVKKRLRELKVDDDFEKLKREMGM
ncbi:hypothetical protein ACHAXA_007252 [Cyclostephanos tholiformis]|uniref:J domain-containing protein n=1 Tax=Cyclostephanos tholiformis TaxID=382380 RepID=A0ABD3SGZ4_9STRA